MEPLVDYPGAGEPWLCRCKTCGEQTTPRYTYVRATGSGCLPCGRRHAAVSRRLDADVAATLMREHGLEPLVEYPGADQPWLCRCGTCERECAPSYSSVRSGRGCRWCGFQRISEALQLDPDAATAFMQGHSLEPLVDYPGAGKPWLCECSACGRTVSPRYNSIKQGQDACRYCSGKTVDPSAAAALMRKRGLEPLVEYPGADQPWLCRCGTCERECAPSYSSVRAGHGCRWCWENRRGDALRLDPEAATAVLRAAGLQPLVDYPGANAQWLCRCEKCGKEVSPSYNSVRDGHGCRYCAALQRGDSRRFPHELAVAFMREQGFEPLEPYRSALAKWRCCCLTCDREVSVKYAKVRNGSGCRYCKKPGFNYSAPSLVYVVIHMGAKAVKPGIANIGTRQDRIASHHREGWALFKTLPCATGEEAWLVERATLVRLWTLAGHKRGYLTAEEMPQYGWTETFDRDEIGEDLVWSIVQEEFARLRSADDNKDDAG
ncbi:hypothetical protein [Kutzneria sp. 744]|uniref:hypothetical protein n=1 Tax=Kutzneria sp. (strain 744) TaxID=345341 RepID=UPI0012F950E3|nr:hypothetical protein [Kutzneria sp. 744]